MIYAKKKVKNAKTLKIIYKLWFINKLKTIKYLMGFFL